MLKGGGENQRLFIDPLRFYFDLILSHFLWTSDHWL